MLVFRNASRVTAIAAVQRHHRTAGADQNHGVGLSDVLRIAQKKFHPGRGRCVANGPGQFGDRFPGNRYDLDNIDPLAFRGRPPGDHDLPGDRRHLFAAALPFVDNHTFIVLCHCLPDNSRIRSSVSRKILHCSIRTAPSDS